MDFSQFETEVQNPFGLFFKIGELDQPGDGLVALIDLGVDGHRCGQIIFVSVNDLVQKGPFPFRGQDGLLFMNPAA